MTKWIAWLSFLIALPVHAGPPPMPWGDSETPTKSHYRCTDLHDARVVFSAVFDSAAPKFFYESEGHEYGCVFSKPAKVRVEKIPPYGKKMSAREIEEWDAYMRLSCAQPGTICFNH